MTFYGDGSSDEMLSILGTNSVTRGSIAALRPRAWLNDEINNFCFFAIAKRDYELKDSNNYHFFNVRFLKLLGKVGCKHSNVKRW